MQTNLIEAYVVDKEENLRIELPTLNLDVIRNINGREPRFDQENLVKSQLPVKDCQYNGRKIGISAHGLIGLCCHQVTARYGPRQLVVKVEQENSLIFRYPQKKQKTAEPEPPIGFEQPPPIMGEQIVNEARDLLIVNSECNVHLTCALSENMNKGTNLETRITIRRQVDGFHKMKDGNIAELEMKPIQSSGIRKGNFFNEMLYPAVIKAHTAKMPILCLVLRKTDANCSNKRLYQKVFFWEDIRLLLPQTCISAVDAFLNTLFTSLTNGPLENGAITGITIHRDGVILNGNNFTEERKLAIGENAKVPKEFRSAETVHAGKSGYKTCIAFCDTTAEFGYLDVDLDTVWIKRSTHTEQCYFDSLENEKYIFVATSYTELENLQRTFTRHSQKYNSNAKNIRFFVLTVFGLSEEQQASVTIKLKPPGEGERVPLRLATDSLDFFKLSTWPNFDSSLLAEPDLIGIIGTGQECEIGIELVKKDFPNSSIFGFALDEKSNHRRVVNSPRHQLENDMEANHFPIMEKFDYDDEKKIWM